MNIEFKPPVLFLVAHWDDEVLLAGGTLKKYGKDWTVVCCTIKDWLFEAEDIFKGVCEDAGAIPITLPIWHRVTTWHDNKSKYKNNFNIFNKSAKRRSLTKELLLKYFEKCNIDINKFNTVITHHSNGDLGGHVHHKQLNNCVKSIFPSKTVYQMVFGSNCPFLNTAGIYRQVRNDLKSKIIPFKDRNKSLYSKFRTHYHAELNKRSDIIIKLDEEEIKWKWDKIHEYYSPHKTQFLSLVNEEGFKKL